MSSGLCPLTGQTEVNPQKILPISYNYRQSGIGIQCPIHNKKNQSSNKWSLQCLISGGVQSAVHQPCAYLDQTRTSSFVCCQGVSTVWKDVEANVLQPSDAFFSRVVTIQKQQQRLRTASIIVKRAQYEKEWNQEP